MTVKLNPKEAKLFAYSPAEAPYNRKRKKQNVLFKKTRDICQYNYRYPLLLSVCRPGATCENIRKSSSAKFGKLPAELTHCTETALKKMLSQYQLRLFTAHIITPSKNHCFCIFYFMFLRWLFCTY